MSDNRLAGRQAGRQATHLARPYSDPPLPSHHRCKVREGQEKVKRRLRGVSGQSERSRWLQTRQETGRQERRSRLNPLSSCFFCFVLGESSIRTLVVLGSGMIRLCRFFSSSRSCLFLFLALLSSGSRLRKRGKKGGGRGGDAFLLVI